MPVTTNFIVNTMGQNVDLGTFINKWNTNVVNIPATGTTLGSYSINYSLPTIITEANIQVTMDGSPSNGDQVYTFGPSKSYLLTPIFNRDSIMFLFLSIQTMP